MPALIPVDNTLGALFIGNVLSSILYGVTWLQVYSYYNSHCSRDRWPLKSFVAFLMLVDTANLVFNTYTTYHVGVTNFGDYRSNRFKSWSQPATALSAIILEVSVQHFYAYRIYRLGKGPRYLPVAISAISLTIFGIGVVYTAKVLKHIHESGSRFQELSIAALSCSVICDILITFGMVYSLLSNRTQFRRTNNVLNLLAIYSINCGTLHLVFAVSCLTLLAKYRDTLVYAPSIFAMSRLYPCAFMSILNSRDNLRETLNGPGGVVATFTQLKVRATTTVVSDAQDTTEASTNTAVPKSLPPLSVSSDTSFSESVMAFDREKYPITL
ncbi:hypothetical protein EDB92DRAFT_2114013 [Lactarius akahatsu]|uniref:DUF6534 domain-containing protein n=1 Tax=Lactarius akahatsu TaxID=416441 RepID=A0AAD4QBJ2_9AGAM|nr:hypothetical protein EDB92DRAFT_2114013 [Lactarius akahatsu]